MGPTDANKLAQMPPSAEVAAAAASVRRFPRRLRSRKWAGQSLRLHHLGRDGADYFATMVTEN